MYESNPLPANTEAHWPLKASPYSKVHALSAEPLWTWKGCARRQALRLSRHILPLPMQAVGEAWSSLLACDLIPKFNMGLPSRPGSCLLVLSAPKDLCPKLWSRQQRLHLSLVQKDTRAQVAMSA